MKTFASSLKELQELLQSVTPLEESLGNAAEMIVSALLNGRKVLACGNGGSSSDASHFTTELACRFREDRRPYPAISLGVDGGLLTAIGNDYDFREIFSRQVRAFGQKGDVLLALSTSGKSRNVLEAIEAARQMRMGTIAILGKGGGFSTGAAEIEIVIPESTATARIQEVQGFLLHVLCEELESRLPKE